MNAKVQVGPRPATAADLERLGLRRVHHFDEARRDCLPQARLEAVRRAALAFREDMLTLNQTVSYYRMVDLIRAPYPTKFGFYNVAKVMTPFMHILNRVFIIQAQTPVGLKTLLFSPSDVDANGETPYFKRLQNSFGPLKAPVSKFIAPVLNRVEDALALAGITPDQVDYLSYDHLHTQDLRKWLGAEGKEGLFPKAKLLVMKQEWDSTTALLPPQRDWYCPQGIDGIDPEKVVLLDGSVMLGDSVALVATPGHTEGNHSLVAHTPEGLMVTSENGVSADSYAPEHSQIPGIRRYALETGSEVILNGNTQEGGLDQYISMVMEKTIAGPSQRHANFTNFVPSSELTPYWGFPGLKPTFAFGELHFGQVSSA